MYQKLVWLVDFRSKGLVTLLGKDFVCNIIVKMNFMFLAGTNTTGNAFYQAIQVDFDALLSFTSTLLALMVITYQHKVRIP